MRWAADIVFKRREAWRWLARLVFVVTGFLALVWFLIRVVPKPSRAAYPCQRAAFPLASSFLLWLVGTSASFSLWRGARYFRVHARGALTVLCAVAALTAALFTWGLLPAGISAADVRAVPLIGVGTDLLEELPARVSLVSSVYGEAAQIDQTEISRMVREAVTLAGGLEGVVSDGDTVVLKPNLVLARDYSDQPASLPPMVNGIATDYRVIQAVVDLVRELDPSGRVVVMETSAGGVTLDNMADLGWTGVSGVDDFMAIEHASGGWYEYDSPLLAQVRLPDELALFPDEAKPNRSRAIYLNRLYFEADVLISLPLLKNHSTAGITGAVKNLSMGALPCNIYGNGPDAGSPYNRGNVIDHSNDNIHRWIHDFYACRQADFSVVDGLQGLQLGPVAVGAGSLAEAQMNSRLILAGDDAVAVDAACGLLMGQDPQLVNYLGYLNNDGFGHSDPALIEVVGERVEDHRQDFANQDFGLDSKFHTFAAADYELDFLHFDLDRNLMRVSVTNPGELARMSFRVDGQPLGLYLVGDFEYATIPLDGVAVGRSEVEVLFEDRYLNSITKTYVGEVGSEIEPPPRRSRGRRGP